MILLCFAITLFYIFWFYDTPFFVCNLEESSLFSTSIFGSAFNDYAVFYGHNEQVYSPNKAERQTETDYVQQSHTIKIIQ